MRAKTDVFSRVKMDALLQDAGRNLRNGSSAPYEQTPPECTRSHYVLGDRQGRPMAALAAKRAGTDPASGFGQGQGQSRRRVRVPC